MTTWLAGMRITADRLNRGSPFVVAHAALTANSANITSTTEVTIVTTGTARFEQGRAYKFEYHGLAQHATASLTDILYLRFRRGSGGLIRNIQNALVANRATTGRNAAIDVATLCTPTSTINDTVTLTAAWDTGSSATFMMAGTSGTPGLLTVWDVGDAADYPGISTF
ncbi:hypothetical protein [Streptomyces gilvus]|uniref:hypothetical protein n=1 Tax=Streptomyces gilvus TaxID=2920937 RepID=UPI001F0D374C|nr:hypothetical protein [Streptomyces sp. CME 23]MCH5677824.1 hypothetical protein [Streptomyces sp. CME 23]